LFILFYRDLTPMGLDLKNDYPVYLVHSFVIWDCYSVSQRIAMKMEQAYAA